MVRVFCGRCGRIIDRGMLVEAKHAALITRDTAVALFIPLPADGPLDDRDSKSIKLMHVCAACLGDLERWWKDTSRGGAP